MKISIRGKMLTTFSSQERNEMLSKLANELSNSAEVAIHRGFERSVQLSAMVNLMTDKEAIRTILRGFKVRVSSFDPLRLKAVFSDDLKHWYDNGENLPEELANVLQTTMDESIKVWLNSREPSEIVAKVLS